MQQNSTLPLLVVFGLDYTIWPFHASNIIPRFTRNREGEIFDSEDVKIHCYPEVPAVLQKIHDLGIKIAACTTGIKPPNTQKILDLLDLNKHFSYKEFLWTGYVQIFEGLRNVTKIQYSDMLFFDDLEYNVKDMEELGVIGLDVPNGMTLQLLNSGLQRFHSSKIIPMKKKKTKKKLYGVQSSEESGSGSSSDETKQDEHHESSSGEKTA